MTPNPIALSCRGNASVVHVGKVAILFSYETAVAFRDAQDRRYVNPRSIGRSNATQAHLTNHGFTHHASETPDT